VQSENYELRKKFELLNKQLDFVLADGHVASQKVIRVGNQRITVDWTNCGRPCEAVWTAENAPLSEMQEDYFSPRVQKLMRGKVKGKPSFTLSSTTSSAGSIVEEGTDPATAGIPPTAPPGSSSASTSVAKVSQRSEYTRPPSRRRIFVPCKLRIGSIEDGGDTTAADAGAQASASPYTTNSCSTGTDDLAQQPGDGLYFGAAEAAPAMVGQAQIPPASTSNNAVEPSSNRTATAQSDAALPAITALTGSGANAPTGTATATAANEHTNSTSATVRRDTEVGAQRAASEGATQASARAPDAGSATTATAESRTADAATDVISTGKPGAVDELARQMILGLDEGASFVRGDGATNGSRATQPSTQRQPAAQQMMTHQNQNAHMMGNGMWGAGYMAYPSNAQAQPQPQQQQQQYAQYYPAQPRQPYPMGQQPSMYPVHNVLSGSAFGPPASHGARPLYQPPQARPQLQQWTRAPSGQAAPRAAPASSKASSGVTIAKPLDYSVLISANTAGNGALPSAGGNSMGTKRSNPNVPASSQAGGNQSSGTAHPSTSGHSAPGLQPPAKKAKVTSMTNANFNKLIQQHQLHKAAVNAMAKPVEALTTAAAQHLSVPVAGTAQPGGSSLHATSAPAASSGGTVLPTTAGKTISEHAVPSSSGANGAQSARAAASSSEMNPKPASESAPAATAARDAPAQEVGSQVVSSSVSTPRIEVTLPPSTTQQAWHDSYRDPQMRIEVIKNMVLKCRHYEEHKEDLAWLRERNTYCTTLEQVLYTQAVTRQQYTHAIAEAVREGLV
jgi:hypothetical protein